MIGIRRLVFLVITLMTALQNQEYLNLEKFLMNCIAKFTTLKINNSSRGLTVSAPPQRDITSKHKGLYECRRDTHYKCLSLSPAFRGLAQTIFKAHAFGVGGDKAPYTPHCISVALKPAFS